LMRVTRSPASGAMTGAVGTALLQSSSATTVAAVGFVGAGLISFPSALGVVFGANLGTTFKGWVIALLGFKYDLDAVFLPMIFVGAVLRLFGGRRLASIGYAAAGFALVFVAITAMQDAMSGLESVVTPESLPRDTWFGRIAIVALGLLATVITQSSSAGVAATITALHAGAITFEQGAALVIGMDVGTTITAALATVGGSTDAKRTGYSHVVYNVLTAIGALLLISPFVAAAEWTAPGWIRSDGELAIVAFHMTFNSIGVLAVLPFTPLFARAMIRLVPEKRDVLDIELETAWLDDASLALNGVQKALAKAFERLAAQVRLALTAKSTENEETLAELESALDRVSEYLDRIHIPPGESPDAERLIALMHALDHAERLLDRCDDYNRIEAVRNADALSGARTAVTDAAASAARALETQEWQTAVRETREAADNLGDMVTPFRETTMADMARGEIEGPKGAEMMSALRWLHRVAKHIASITHYLERGYQAAGKERTPSSAQ